MKEPKQWITVNGVHVPIFDGESKEDAVNRFLKNKSNKERDASTKEKQIKSNEDEADKLNNQKDNTVESFKDMLIRRYGEYALYLPDLEVYVGTDDTPSSHFRINNRLSNAKVLGIYDKVTDSDSNESRAILGIDEAMNIHPLEQNSVLYRGVDRDAYFTKMKVGDVVDMNGRYTSTTTSLRVANEYVGNESSGYLLEIHAPKGTPSVDMKRAFKNKSNVNAKSESEVLLSRYLKYRVIDKDDKKITFEIIDDDIDDDKKK